MRCPTCGALLDPRTGYCYRCQTYVQPQAVQPSGYGYTTRYPARPREEMGYPIVSFLSLQPSRHPFIEKASRLELFIRIVWGILIVIVLGVYSIVYHIIILVYSIIAWVLGVIHLFYILILGKRWPTACKWVAKAVYEEAIPRYLQLWNYALKRYPYLLLLSDDRPSLGMDAPLQKP